MATSAAATSAATAARQACAELLAAGIATNCDLASPHDVGDGRKMSTSVLLRLSQFVSRFLGGDAALPQVAVANGFCHHVRTALVVEPSNEAQVAVAVRTAAKWALPLSVASGGHSYICQSVKRGSLHLRLRRLRETHFDPEALTLRMQTGLTFRDVLWRVKKKSKSRPTQAPLKPSRAPSSIPPLHRHDYLPPRISGVMTCCLRTTRSYTVPASTLALGASFCTAAPTTATCCAAGRMRPSSRWTWSLRTAHSCARYAMTTLHTLHSSARSAALVALLASSPLSPCRCSLSLTRRKLGSSASI